MWPAAGLALILATTPSIFALAGSLAVTPVVHALDETVVFLVAGWVAGAVVRWRREVAAQRARAAVADERLRIARDLHDIVGHSMSVIAVKATVANHVAATRPDQVQAALTDIEEISRAALEETRRLLNTFKPGLEPVPGLAQLGALCDSARAAGVETTLDVRAEDAVPEAVALTAYRIVQEALTNVVRHAAAGSCRVAVFTRENGLAVEVTDDGRDAPREPRAGHGLTGMRERVALYGGTLSAGPPRSRRLLSDGDPAVQPRQSRPGDPAVRVMSIRVLLADDHTVVRNSFRLLFESSPDFVVVGEAGDGLEAVTAGRACRPDVVLMDIRLPRLDGLEATRRLTAAGPLPRVIILTTFDLDDYVHAAVQAGASGFLVKDVSAAALLDAVRAVAGGQTLLAPGTACRPLLGLLTEREREVLVLIARGRSNAELARELHITRGTVKTHIGRLLSKLHARDRAQLVIAAYEAGLITAS